jgi:hypothetical protein
VRLNQVKLRSMGGMQLVVPGGTSWFAGTRLRLRLSEICQQVGDHEQRRAGRAY